MMFSFVQFNLQRVRRIGSSGRYEMVGLKKHDPGANGRMRRRVDYFPGAEHMVRDGPGFQIASFFFFGNLPCTTAASTCPCSHPAPSLDLSANGRLCN